MSTGRQGCILAELHLPDHRKTKRAGRANTLLPEVGGFAGKEPGIPLTCKLIPKNPASLETAIASRISSLQRKKLIRERFKYLLPS